MSIVVAVKKNDKTVVCSDSQVNFGSMSVDSSNYKACKIWRWGDNIICRTGWEKYQLLLRNFLLSHDKQLLSDETVVADLFQQFWKHCKSEHGLVSDQAGNHNTPWLNADSDFMIVNRNGIFQVSSDLSVARYEHFHATGSGRDWALGAISALYPKKNESALQIAKQAVKIGCTYNVFCGGPVKTIQVT